MANTQHMLWAEVDSAYQVQEPAMLDLAIVIPWINRSPQTMRTDSPVSLPTTGTSRPILQYSTYSLSTTAVQSILLS